MNDRSAGFDEDGLPWLEAVPDEDGPRGISASKMIAALGMVILAVLLIAATMFVVGRRAAGPTTGAPELIKADPRPYKVKPVDPGGLDVAGDSQTAFATSAGADTDAQIDMNAVSETPMVRPQVKPKPAEKPKTFPSNETREPVPEIVPAAKPAPAEVAPTGGSGSLIQLGAFSSGAKAEAAWKALTARFPGLTAMGKIVVPVSGSALYRLRAGASSPADAKAMCQTLRVAGESCVVIG